MRELTAAVALALAFGWTEGAGAQQRSGQVVPSGQVRLTVGAESVRADSRFGAETSLAGEPLDALTPATFLGLEETADALSAFLLANGNAPVPVPANPENLSAGTLSADLSANYRYLPIRLSLGILPRLEIAVELPVYRTEGLFTRLDLAEGNVGLNAASAQLLPVLSLLGPTGAALANSPLLPLADSPLGVELRRRVLALTGQELALPTSPVTYAELRSRYQSVLRPSRTLGEWQPGDVEVEARFGLFRSFDEAFFPAEDARAGYRLTAVAAARIPTGKADEVGFGLAPGVGYTGVRAGAIADVFVGRNYWINAGGMFEMLGAGKVAVLDAGGPHSGSVQTTLNRTPGAAIDLWLEPKRRLTTELAMGAVARSELWGEGEDELAGVALPIEAGSRHSLGASLTYSTLAAPEAERRLPLEATVGFRTSVAGTDGTPNTSVAYFQLSLLRRLWGGAQ